MKLDKYLVFYIVVSLSMLAMLMFGMYSSRHAGHYRREGVYFLPARVVEVVEDRSVLNHFGARQGSQELRVRLLAGPRRGDIINAQNILFPIEHGVYAQVGNRLLIFFEQWPGAAYYDYFAYVQSHDRSRAIYLVVILFFGLLAAVFGKTGIKSAFSLVFTFVVIIYLLLPLIVRGWPPALLTTALSFVIISVSSIAIMGFGKKTYVSIAGTTLGIAFYGIFYLLIGAMLRITGFNVQETDRLIVSAGHNVGISELLFCAILIASLGALMDVAVSLASAVAELSLTNKNAGFKDLFRFGMKVARDIIGSSSNTLILAFTGTFFITLILFNVNNVQYIVLINRADIGIEVLRAISASAAMVLCAPATVLIGSHVFSSKEGRRKVWN